ncbi:unnamed protein product [Cuscuta campestris]|uniref:Actin-related protein 7 n=1 Tax=Cuscuta campestris TaxID=132261 RepID=A0A484NJ27_9ASTE|nr:unnamed protein product [Cuscuta campestris]
MTDEEFDQIYSGRGDANLPTLDSVFEDFDEANLDNLDGDLEPTLQSNDVDVEADFLGLVYFNSVFVNFFIEIWICVHPCSAISSRLRSTPESGVLYFSLHRLLVFSTGRSSWCISTQRSPRNQGMEAVVVDAGSKFLKSGFAIPDQAPSMIIPTQMKRVPEDESALDAAVEESTEEEAVNPIVRGFVKDWDAMEDLLHHVLYTGLGWEIGNEGQILFTDPLCTPKAIREQLVQLMFETFNISGFYASEQAVLSLYAVGRISGCTVDIGHGKIDIAPVIEGAVQHLASRRLELGGADLTQLLAEKLSISNPMVKFKMSDVEKIKEQYACCAEEDISYDKMQQSILEEEHILPDGQIMYIK